MKHLAEKISAVFFLVAVVLFTALPAKSENRITRDPFAQPELAKRKPKIAAPKSQKSSAEIIREETAKLELRATIRTGNWSMANINGTMVEEGGEIEGFTLLQIGEDEVLLRKKGVEVILAMPESNTLPAQ